jgi:predicted nucleic acid-binding protein
MKEDSDSKFYFFDASALIKNYKPEIGSDVVKEIFKRYPYSQIWTSCVALGEVFNSLKEIDNRQLMKEAIENFEMDLRSGIINIRHFESKEINAMMNLMLGVRGIRGEHNKVDPPDVVYFLTMKDTLNRNFSFVCSDSHLCTLAKSEKYNVINPLELSNQKGDEYDIKRLYRWVCDAFFFGWDRKQCEIKLVDDLPDGRWGEYNSKTKTIKIQNREKRLKNPLQDIEIEYLVTVIHEVCHAFLDSGDHGEKWQKMYLEKANKLEEIAVEIRKDIEICIQSF